MNNNCTLPYNKISHSTVHAGQLTAGALPSDPSFNWFPKTEDISLQHGQENLHESSGNYCLQEFNYFVISI